MPCWLVPLKLNVFELATLKMCSDQPSELVSACFNGLNTELSRIQERDYSSAEISCIVLKNLLLRRLIEHGRLAHSVCQRSQRPLLEVPVVEACEGGRGEGHVHAVLHPHGVHRVSAHGAHAPPVQGPRHWPGHGPALPPTRALVDGGVLRVQAGGLYRLHGHLTWRENEVISCHREMIMFDNLLREKERGWRTSQQM